MMSLSSRITDPPAARILSDGTHVTLFHGSGAGFSRYRWMALNDWNADPLEERGGVRFHLSDRASGAVCTLGAEGYSNTQDVEPGAVAGTCASRCICDGLEVTVEACVGGRSLEARRITLRNAGATSRNIDITSSFEIALAHPSAHASHPAFSKLFVQTEFDRETGLLLAQRRPRANNENSPCVINAFIGEGSLEVETDRLHFLGRGGLPHSQNLGGHTGNVLDPMFAMRRSVGLAAGAEATFVWVLCAGESKDEAVERWKSWRGFKALAAEAVAHEKQRYEALGLSEEDALKLQSLAVAMFYGESSLGAPPITQNHAVGGFGNVWGCGMPTDRPYAVVLPGDQAVMNDAVNAQRYWSALGLNTAMLLLTDGSHVLTEHEASSAGIVQRPLSSLPQTDLDALLSVARLVVSPHPSPSIKRVKSGSGVRSSPKVADAPSRLDEPLHMDNGYGGFSADGREYVIRIGPTTHGLSVPPLPWINVLANEHGFGCLVSETGAGCTWARNSRERRLTPWSNDPVLDPHGEALYLRDDDNGSVWSPMPGPSPSGAAYETRHGWGRTVFRHQCADLQQTTTVFVDRTAPVKFIRVEVLNLGPQTRRLSLVSYARLVLGFLPGETSRLVRVQPDDELHALNAVNRISGEFADGVAFAAVDARELPWSASTSRICFLGADGDMTLPASLANDHPFCSDDDGQRDPCFAQKVTLELPPRGRRSVTFLLGEASSLKEAVALIQRFRQPGAVDAALSEVTAFWEQTLTSVQVRTPSPAIDFMVNGWLAYQNLSSRVWARTAFYQCSGAFGFRDQLQDVGSMVYLRPDLTRKQILLHAAQQFEEGDVTHWWHEAPIGRGLRTRFSDDLNWLPYITAFYVRSTGDASVLEEIIPFITARQLDPGEDEAYLAPAISGESGTVYEHCCRALDRSLTKGAHGLPLMGTGDWNDGMNRVGREGKGESVWMGFFLFEIIEDFLPLCEQRGDSTRVKRYSEYRDHLRTTLNDTGWDGEWYRRAYYDDGTPLGSKVNDECRIDALAQAWAVISGVAPKNRAAQAMDAVEKYLISEKDGIIRLLAPSFVNTPHDPGYIKGYVAGVRENGGQYTHAACWVVKALAELGRTERAARLLEMLSPVSHASTREDADRFKLEPFVVAADVYGEPPHVGRGGWSWYTGSAGWLYRVALESVLGLQLLGGSALRLKPCIPRDWPGFEITLRPHGNATTFTVKVSNAHRGDRVVSAELDGSPLAVVDGAFEAPLPDDGVAHTLLVTL